MKKIIFVRYKFKLIFSSKILFHLSINRNFIISIISKFSKKRVSERKYSIQKIANKKHVYKWDSKNYFKMFIYNLVF